VDGDRRKAGHEREDSGLALDDKGWELFDDVPRCDSVSSCLVWRILHFYIFFKVQHPSITFGKKVNSLSLWCPARSNVCDVVRFLENTNPSHT
jgi:hypothetical protein